MHLVVRISWLQLDAQAVSLVIRFPLEIERTTARPDIIGVHRDSGRTLRNTMEATLFAVSTNPDPMLKSLAERANEQTPGEVCAYASLDQIRSYFLPSLS